MTDLPHTYNGDELPEDEDNFSLEKDLASNPHFDWSPGMWVTDGARLGILVGRTAGGFIVVPRGGAMGDVWTQALPDLRAPATKGCVLDMGRRGWGGDVFVGLAHVGEDQQLRWWIYGVPQNQAAYCNNDGEGYDSEGSALAHLVLLAPRRDRPPG